MISRADLHDRFVSVADELMLARGWERDPRGEGHLDLNGVTLGMFMRSRDDGFRAHVSFELQSTFGGTSRDGQIVRPPHLRVSLELGLRYLPADRLQRLLKSNTSSFAAIDLREVVGAEAADTREFSDLAGSERAARHLVAAVDEHALAILDQYVDIDAFLGLYVWASPESERFVVPAVLGAGGRTAEAQTWLDDNSGRRRSPKGEPNGYGEYADRLHAWLAAGARVPDESDLPAEPSNALPAAERWDYEPVDLSERDLTRRTSAMKKEIFQRARAAGSDLSREQRRELLITELSRNGIDADPIWIESALDNLDLSGTDAVKATGAALLGLGRSIVSAIRNADIDPGSGEPVWMAAPQDTWRRSVQRVAQVITINLDEDSQEFLTRVYGQSPFANSSLTESFQVDVWLAWDPAPRTDQSVLAAHIGPHRVGTVPPAAVDAYVPMIDAVQATNMWPRIEGELAQLNSGVFLLQIPMPAPQ